MESAAKQNAHKTQGLSFSNTKVSAFDANDALIDKKLAALTADAKIDSSIDKTTVTDEKSTAHTTVTNTVDRDALEVASDADTQSSGKDLPPAHGMSAKAAENDLDGYFAKQNAKIQEEDGTAPAS
jgi:hypothetical protein